MKSRSKHKWHSRGRSCPLCASWTPAVARLHRSREGLRVLLHCATMDLTFFWEITLRANELVLRAASRPASPSPPYVLVCKGTAGTTATQVARFDGRST